MREFATPLAERRRLAAYQRAKYWSDPEYRLRKINNERRWKGLEPYESLDQAVRLLGPRY